MTLKDGKEHGMLTGGLFKFWGADWPDPGGTEFQAEVYDASGLMELRQQNCRLRSS